MKKTLEKQQNCIEKVSRKNKEEFEELLNNLWNVSTLNVISTLLIKKLWHRHSFYFFVVFVVFFSSITYVGGAKQAISFLSKSSFNSLCKSL